MTFYGHCVKRPLLSVARGKWPTVVQLPSGKALTVRAAADVFLDSLGNPNTVRNYGIGAGKTAERLGEARPPASVAADEIGEALELLWDTAAVNTWNARRAAVLSWLGWCRERGYLLDEHTTVRGPGTGWDLHEYRHSAVTHLGEQGASPLMLMAKSRHKKPENLRRYFKPSDEPIAEVTSLLAPGDARR